MKVKLKIIEFSSDIFSKSSQLKDIHLSPLFSNINFNINIFDAISKNEEYEIRVNSPLIKIGLYQSKSLLGIGILDINKKSNKIKITSEQNINQINLFQNNSNNNKIKDNDFYIIIECINNNQNNDKFKNLNTKDSNHKRKKNSSVDSNKKDIRCNIYDYNKIKLNKYKINNSLKEYINNCSVEQLNKLSKKKNESREDLIISKKSFNNNLDNNNDDNIFNKKSNSTIINDSQNKIMQNLFLSENDKKDFNVKESNQIIFNESFQKENFSDGVLILNDDKNKDENLYLNNILNMENIDINSFENLINDFYLIYNNVINNNSLGSNNLKDNFIIEYQYFLEKTFDIFNLYTKLSNELYNQNAIIKKYINNLNNQIKFLLKKDLIIKVKRQKIGMIELSHNNYQESKKYHEHEIKSINNKLSIVKDILTTNLRNNKKEDIKNLFNAIINNENIKEYLKIDEFFIKFMTNQKSVKFKLDNINENNENVDKNEKENSRQKENIKDNCEKKVDIETLKNKIDKLKIQYLKETIPKELNNKAVIYGTYKNKKPRETKSQKKINSHYVTSNNRSIKDIHKLNKNKSNDNPNISEINNNIKYKKYNNYYNLFTPNNSQRIKLMKSRFKI